MQNILASLNQIENNMDFYIPSNIFYTALDSSLLGDYKKGFTGKRYWLKFFFKDWSGKKQVLTYSFDTENKMSKHQAELPKGYRIEKEELDMELANEFILFLNHFFGKSKIDNEHLNHALNTVTFCL